MSDEAMWAESNRKLGWNLLIELRRTLEKTSRIVGLSGEVKKQLRTALGQTKAIGDCMRQDGWAEIRCQRCKLPMRDAEAEGLCEPCTRFLAKGGAW